MAINPFVSNTQYTPQFGYNVQYPQRGNGYTSGGSTDNGNFSAYLNSKYGTPNTNSIYANGRASAAQTGSSNGVESIKSERSPETRTADTGRYIYYLA